MLSPQKKFRLGMGLLIAAALLSALFVYQGHREGIWLDTAYSTMLTPAVPNRRLPSLVRQKSDVSYHEALPQDETLYQDFYRKKIPLQPSAPVVAGIVPSDLLSGHLAASFFEAQKAAPPSTVVILSLNRAEAGQGHIITSPRDWSTPYGVVRVAEDAVNRLIDDTIAVSDESIGSEQGIAGTVSFIGASFPDTRIIPIMLHSDIQTVTMDRLAEALARIVPPDTVFVAVADVFGDGDSEIPMEEINTVVSVNLRDPQYERLGAIETDALPVVYVLLKTVRNVSAEKVPEVHSFPPGDDITAGQYYAGYISRGKEEDPRGGG